ncbi:MAG: MaoC/PaaZ C-terminal domain-containing protein [Proteobacteria bacterium]|nr:MaoC/PaaZ C-terminal domain-containing protein [Pseudomonadota bacterium]
MMLPAGIVGAETGPLEQQVDARWLMAYAAALGETDPRYFDTRGVLLAHPLFPVCYEWPAALAVRAHCIPEEVADRVVHATHDLTLHRAPRAGDVLQTRARLVSLEARAAGAFLVIRMETRDARGYLVSVTDYGSLYRGVAIEGLGATSTQTRPPTSDAPALLDVGVVPLAATLAHTYSECARIWNPIHTDAAHAHAVGLPGIILHGTATLAVSVSKVLAAHGVDAAVVRRIRARFSGMVPMPSTLSLSAARDAGRLYFEVRCAGVRVIADGLIDTSA